jgi:phage tail tape-measure protein
LGLSGNLNPQNALFTGALNATNLLTKSPLKATAIGAVASLGATAATGGDIGRTVFNLLGSIGGGALGAVATGGIGSLGGSVAGGFVADELWKALFGQGDNWSIRRQTSPSINTPDINVRVP